MIVTSDDAARENVHGPVRRPRSASVKDSETSVETGKFSNRICGSEKVAIIVVEQAKHLISVREIVRNLAADGLLETL